MSPSTKQILIAVILAFAVAALSACEPAVEPAEPDSAPQTGMEEDMSSDDHSTTDLRAGIAAARADLAGRLNIEEQDIEVAEAREVIWRDGALGCPEPDMMYTQALVRGFYIRLRASDDDYAYHSGRDGQPFLCPQDRSQPPLEDDAALY